MSITLKSSVDGLSGAIQINGVDRATFNDAGVLIQGGLLMNSNTIDFDATIPENYNALSTGPITVASTNTITVSANSRWVVI